MRDQFHGLERPARVFIGLAYAYAVTEAAVILANLVVALSPAGVGRTTAFARTALCLLLAQMVIFTVAGLAYLVWFHRAYLNLPRLGIPDPRHGTVWTIAGWFVPVAAVFVPKRMHNDLWRASDPDLPWPAPRALWDGRRLPGTHLWWWLTFLVAAGTFHPVAVGDPDDPGFTRWWALGSSVMAALALVCSLLVIPIVRDVTARQRARAARAPRALGAPVFR